MTVFPVRLEPWTDVIGTLRELLEQDGCLIAKIGPVVVALPWELHEKLKDHIGERVGVLRADTDYRFRIIEMRR